MGEVTQSFELSLFENAYDMSMDYAELALDTIFEDGVLKEIPIVKTIYSIGKMGFNIKDRHLLKEQLVFIQEFKDRRLSEEAKQKHHQRYVDNPKQAEKELGRVMVLLDGHTENLQSQILARFYAAFLRGAISWERFAELSEINRRMLITDLPVLEEAFKNDGLDINDRELYQVDRLISLGLLQNSNRLGGLIIMNIAEEEKKDILITSLGKTYCQHSRKKRD